MALLTRWYRLYLISWALNIPTAVFAVALVVEVLWFKVKHLGPFVSNAFVLMVIATVIVTFEQITLYAKLRRKGVL